MALQHAIIQLAPIDPDDIDVDGAGDGIVTDGSPAAQFLTDRLTTMAETGTGPSGEVVDAEVLELRDTGQQATAELCVLQETEPVDLSTGEPTEGAPAQSDARYLQIEVTYTYVDGDWLIDELPGLEDDGRPDDCVPPSIAQAVQANWEAHDEAGRRWIDSGFAIEERAALEPLVTEARWEEIEAIEPEEPTGRVRATSSTASSCSPRPAPKSLASGASTAAATPMPPRSATVRSSRTKTRAADPRTLAARERRVARRHVRRERG